MLELTLKIDSFGFFNKELEEYLKSLKGVLESKVDPSINEVYIKYDSKLINIKIIKMEILLFLSLQKIPSMISFNKHSKNKTINYSIIIKDLCCEYCLKGIIEDLLDIDGIESAESDFDYNNKKDVTINISYDSTLITEKEIKNLEIKLNS